MSGKEACGIAYKNIKGRRKTGHLLFFILFLALFLYFVINSIALSVNQAVRLTKEVPIARNLIFQDKDGTLYTRLKKVCEDMEYVSEVYPYVGYEKQYFYAVVLDKRENLEVVGREISQALDVGGSPEAHFVEGGAEAVLSFIQMIGTGLTVILLIVVIIMLGIMIGNDIRGRKKEMAMYLVQGYTKRNLLHILGMEYAIRLFPVLVSSVIVTIVTLILANVGIEKMLSMEYRVIHMGFSVDSFFAGIGILAIVFCIAVYTISEQLKKINVLKEIKSEG